MALRRAYIKTIDLRRLSQNCLKMSMVTQASQTQEKPYEQSEGQTHFGFQTVNEEEKWKKVHEVFETVAEKYDLMNDVMSLGIHRVWKDVFMQRLAPMHGTKLLDMAGGTGDITFRYVKYLQNLGPAPDGARSSVTVCDINQAMLDVGKTRAEKCPISKLQAGSKKSSNWSSIVSRHIVFDSIKQCRNGGVRQSRDSRKQGKTFDNQYSDGLCACY